MARFALLLPREEMVEPAGRIARELEMDVVLNQSVPTERILDLMEDCPVSYTHLTLPTTPYV